MFSELEAFADETNTTIHVDENSNEENDVDDETMSGKLEFTVSFILFIPKQWIHGFPFLSSHFLILNFL